MARALTFTVIEARSLMGDYIAAHAEKTTNGDGPAANGAVDALLEKAAVVECVARTVDKYTPSRQLTPDDARYAAIRVRGLLKHYKDDENIHCY